MFFPIFAMAYVPVVNLPDLLGVRQLALSQLAIARIFQGLVTQWNDPLIAATNRADIGLPNQTIEVVLLREAQSYIDTFIANMKLIDPINFTVPWYNTFSTPGWPTANYAKFTFVDRMRDVASYVRGNPYSIGLSYLNVAKGFKAQIANLVNDFGLPVQPTYISTAIAFAERAILSQRAPDGSLVKSQPLDLLRPPGPNSWPWLQISTLVVPRSFSRGDSCVARSEMVKFIRWMLHSTQITDVLATAEGVALISDDINQGLSIEQTILTQTTCGGSLVNTGTDDLIQTGGATTGSMHTPVRSLLSVQYSIETKQPNSFTVMDEADSIASSIDPVGSQDVTWIYTTTFYDLYPGVLEGLLANGLTLIHVALAGVVPIFNLPADVQPRMQSSLPLVFDMETLALIFLGEIASWTDPRLATHAPNLAAAFAGASTTNITVVLCGEGQPGDAPYTVLPNHWMQAMSRTNAFHQLGFNYSLPADWRPMAARMAANGVQFVFVASEVRMEATVASTPGAIGYMLMANNFTTIENEIQIAMPVALDADNPTALTWLPVAATPSNLLACLAAQQPTAAGYLVFRTDSVTGAEWQNCWPVPMFVSLGLATDVRTATIDRFGNTHVSSNLQTLCAREQKLVEYVRYWAYLPEVNVPLRLAGRVAISELKPWEAEIKKALFQLSCGGQPILWNRPVVWQLSSAVAAFGFAITIVGLILTIGTAAFVFAFRRRTIITSSHLPRQLLVLCGLSLLFCAPLLFSLTPAVSTCNLLSWLLFVGASLTFGPICGRLHRVYVSYRLKQSLRRKPLAQLLQFWSWPVVLFSVDLIVLAVAQSGDGLLRPIMTTLLENNVDHQYTICAVPSALLPHAAILAGVHLAALLWTSSMAFKVRHVTTAFKESANLSWAVWNAVLSTALIVPLIILTGGLQGDTGVFLLLFLVSWIALCTLGFDFGFKLWILIGEEIALAKDRASRSSRSGMTSSGKATGSHTSASGGTGSGTGSGAALSILEMPVLDGITSITTIEQYIVALERQLRLAKEARVGGRAKSSVGAGDSGQISDLRQRRSALSEDTVLSDENLSSEAASHPIASLEPRGSHVTTAVPSAASVAPSSPQPRPLVLFRAPSSRPTSVGAPTPRTPIRIGLGARVRSPSGSPHAGAVGAFRFESPPNSGFSGGGRPAPATRPPRLQLYLPADRTVF